MQADAAAQLAAPPGFDLDGTVTSLSLGRRDPTWRHEAGDRAVAFVCPEGPVTLRALRRLDVVDVEAWGPGAAWATARAARWLGLDRDNPFEHPALAPVDALRRRHAGRRLARSLDPTGSLLHHVLGQRVTFDDARRAWKGACLRWGEPAPGPLGLQLPPSFPVLARLPYEAWHPLGVERRRALLLAEVARLAPRIDARADGPADEARAWIRKIPGIGPWTEASWALTSLGDADAVPLGDFHLPNTVAWALAGEARADDARMLTLLEPFRPVRGALVNLLIAAHVTAPRYGPRLSAGLTGDR